MSRVIKFRVWDKEKKKYFEPTYEAYKGNLEDLSIGLSGDLCMRTLEAPSIHDSVFPDRFIIEQFTGLTDKNGKEIYCGDTCKLHYFTQELGENLGVVEGEDEIIGTINIRPLGLFVNDEPIIMYFDDAREHSEDHFEITGNIHDK